MMFLTIFCLKKFKIAILNFRVLYSAFYNTNWSEIPIVICWYKTSKLRIAIFDFLRQKIVRNMITGVIKLITPPLVSQIFISFHISLTLQLFKIF